jgi:hypothetical protein
VSLYKHGGTWVAIVRGGINAGLLSLQQGIIKRCSHGTLPSPSGAIVSDDSAEEASGSAGNNTNGGAEEKKGESLLRRLLVRVGPGKVQELLSTQVYWFRASRSEGGGEAEADRPLPARILPVATTPTPVSQAGGSSPVPVVGAERDSPVPVRPAGPVPTAQVLQAVDDVLRR